VRVLPALLCSALVASGLLITLPAEAATPKPTSLKTASGGHHDTSVKVQWKWHSGVSSYQLQAAADTSFSPVAKAVTVKGTKRPSGGLMKVSVANLENATSYDFRVRAVAKGHSSAWSSVLTSATTVALPGKVLNVTAQSGAGGGVTFSWMQDGSYTTSYQLETALSLFSKTPSSSLPLVGRHSRLFDIDGGKRSFTLTPAQLAEAGAPVGSATHLLYRFSAINHGTAGEQIRRYPYLQAIMPDESTGTGGGDSRPVGTRLRVANFNVRTAKATTDARPWLDRRADVAQQIVSRGPDIVTMQELGPGRADGKDGSTTGVMRQTTSLLDTLHTMGDDNYKLVRTTPYVPAGEPHGSQGTRILYNSDAVSLLSDCPDNTGNRSSSNSCSIELPLLPGDTRDNLRTAAYAEFKVTATGAKFWIVSAHLDARHSSSAATETTYNGLRGSQMDKILDTLKGLDTDHVPMLLGGDLNSWQNIATGNAPHDELIDHGFLDSASAPSRINLQYSTFNNFAKTQEPSGVGFASRLDGIYIDGGTASTFENVTKVTDPARPSDHNMIIANLLLTDLASTS
jgi:endonuclease/exonuclease/phosphatase family metal-dependent hydrolase